MLRIRTVSRPLGRPGPWLALLALLICAGAAPAGAQYTFQECDVLDEHRLRDELREIARQVLDDNRLNVDRVIDRQWQQLAVGEVLEREVGRAVADVRAGEAYLSRLWSAWSPDKANELAARVAGAAFESPAFQDAITELSGAIAGDVAVAMERMSARSASSTLGCLQTFIGARYSLSLLDVFDAEIQAQVDTLALDRQLAGELSIAGMHGKALAGVGAIIGAQIARQMARRMAARVTGRIATRVAGRAAAALVPVVGWVAGAGMIAWDLWEGTDGALPQIEEALTGPDVEAEIKAEINAAVTPELERELPRVARAVSDSIFATWQRFKQQYAQVLQLAERSPAFRAILDDTATGQIYKLADLVAVGNETLGREALEREIDRGRFARLFALPDGAAQVLADARSVDAVLAWGELAGDELTAVARLGIHRRRQPDDLDAPALAALIALNDPGTVERLLQQPQEVTDALLTLPAPALRTLAQRYQGDDLGWLARYARGIADADARGRLLSRLTSRPELMARLKHGRVEQAIAAGADIDGTLDFVADGRTLSGFIADAGKLAGGSVSPGLFWFKYGTARNIAIVAALLGVWLLLRRLRRRRERPIVINVTAPPGSRIESDGANIVDGAGKKR